MYRSLVSETSIIEEVFVGKNNDSNVISRAYIDSLTIEQRLIDAVLPSPKAKILGKEFATPIMNAAFSFLAASHPVFQYPKRNPVCAVSRLQSCP